MMVEPSETVKTILEQIDWRELRMVKVKIAIDNANDSVILGRAGKTMVIRYDSGSDTYTVQEYREHGTVLTNTSTNVYFEDLQPRISRFFKFEYVMRGLKLDTGQGGWFKQPAEHAEAARGSRRRKIL